MRREPQHGHAHPDRHDAGAAAALALAGCAVAVAGLALVLPTVRAAADGARRLAPGGRVAAAATSDAPPAAFADVVAVTAPTDVPADVPADVSAEVPAPADLPLGACLRTDVPDVRAAQAGLDAGCTVELAYGPARWLAAHDHDAGDAWKALPDGAEFVYSGRTYRVVDRARADYVTGPVALDPLVHGDLTLQTCDGADRLVFLHAALVG